MIENGEVLVNGRNVSAHYPVKRGETVVIHTGRREQDRGTRAEDIPIDIIFEDAHVLVVNKAPGMVVHPAHGNPTHTLVNALLYHVQSLSDGSEEARPGIVHRLDKDTSGIMVVAKNNLAHEFLARQFRKYLVDKRYQVVVRGNVQHEEGICEEPVGRAFLNRKKVIIKPSGGKDATTYYRVLKRFGGATLLEVRPRTGRTHQIRVHMTHLGHPVLGDMLYGIPSPWINRQALHAAYLEFTHPETKQRVHFEAALPADMTALLRRLEQEKK